MEATSDVKSHPLHTDWSRVPVEVLDDGTERQMVVGERLMVCRLRFALARPRRMRQAEQGSRDRRPRTNL